MWTNMLIKLGSLIQWTNCSLKTWRFELVSFSLTTDICTVTGLSVVESRWSTECTVNVSFLAVTRHHAAWSHSLAVDCHRNYPVIFKVVFDTCSLGHVLSKFQFFHLIISSFFLFVYFAVITTRWCVLHMHFFFPAVSTKSHRSVIL